MLEALLGVIGIRRKRPHRSSPQDPRDGGGSGGNGFPGDPGNWEVDIVQLLGCASGALLAGWAMNRLRMLDVQPAPVAVGDKALVPAPINRMMLSDFLLLLRLGHVTAVTYLADRHPAGAFLVKSTKLPPQADRPVAPIRMDPLAMGEHALAAKLGESACVPGAATEYVSETLLVPGCHQSVFGELAKTDQVSFECADVRQTDADYISMWSTLIDLGGLVLSGAALYYAMRGTFGNGTFTGRHIEEDASDSAASARPSVTFEDVAGMENTKEELKEVISFLRNPADFYALGARPPRGILLAGPSGTGKTLLSRAVAGEAGVPFLYASGSEFVEVYVGQGARRVRELYEQARGCAPSIVFLDEIDAVGAHRMSCSGGSQEYVQTVNQLLVELDGIDSSIASQSAVSSTAPVVVTMGATNRYDMLDEALVRPGRLDRIVLIGLPNQEERLATLRVHARRLLTDNLDFEVIAQDTDGMSHAELANLLNEAALLAARRKATAVRREHINEVLSTPRPRQGAGRSGAAGHRRGMPSTEADDALVGRVVPQDLAEALRMALPLLLSPAAVIEEVS